VIHTQPSLNSALQPNDARALLTMRRHSLLVLFVSTLLLTSACGGDTAGPLVTARGTYTLQTINGVLPLRLFHNDASGQTTIDIVSGTLTLNANATFREVL